MSQEVEAAFGAWVRVTVGVKLVPLAAQVARGGVSVWQRGLERGPMGWAGQAAATLWTKVNGALAIF